MPNIKEIKDTILTSDIPSDVIAKFDFPKVKGNPPGEVVALISRMEQLLTPEQCLSVMAEQGCSKTGVVNEMYTEFGCSHADKPFDVKLALMKESGPHRYKSKREVFAYEKTQYTA